MAKDPKRTDIVKEYLNVVHETIATSITNFWDIYHTNMGVITFLNDKKKKNNNKFKN